MADLIEVNTEDTKAVVIDAAALIENAIDILAIESLVPLASTVIIADDVAPNEEDETLVGDFGTTKRKPILLESSLMPSAISSTTATTSKSRTNSLGKLFQKMRSSEMLARLKKEAGVGGSNGCSAEPTVHSGNAAGGGESESTASLRANCPMKKLSVMSTTSSQKGGSKPTFEHNNTLVC